MNWFARLFSGSFLRIFSAAALVVSNRAKGKIADSSMNELEKEIANQAVDDFLAELHREVTAQATGSPSKTVEE